MSREVVTHARSTITRRFGDPRLLKLTATQRRACFPKQTQSLNSYKMSQNGEPPRESDAIPGAREPVSFLAAEDSRDVVLEWLVEHFSSGLMNVPENGRCRNNFKKRCPFLPRVLVNPCPSVEEV